MLRYATPLAFAAMGGIFSRAERRREHRPRGNDALGRLLRHPRRRQAELVAARAPVCGAGRRSLRARPRLLRDPSARGPDRRRVRDQLPRTRDHRLPLHRHLRRRGHAAGHPRDPGRPPRLPDGLVLHRARARPAQPDDLARSADHRRHVGRDVQDADRTADPRRRRAPARRRHGRDLGLQDPVRVRWCSRASSPRSGAPISRSGS